MIRHILVAPVKQGTPDAILEEKITEMRELETAVEGIVGFAVGRNLGLAGLADAVTMVVDCKDEASFNALLACPQHCAIADAAAEAFRPEAFTLAQIEVR